ncbi:MAG: SusD/RagB family nutrient-binding outer membrane lipoprotein [Flavobacteriaceae bacterium]
MKRHIFKITILSLLVFAYNCSDYLDVNHNPNVIENIDDPKIILPTAQVTLGNNLMGWDFGFGGGYWSEYWTQAYTASQFKVLCQYEDVDFDYAYTGLVTETLIDLKTIKELSTENEEYTGYAYIAEALSIFTWQIATDVWGDIPYTEALQGNQGVLSPVFDSGESIYADLLKRVNALIATDPSDYYVTPNTDFIYGGDMEQWMYFANALKLKLMLRLSETSGYNNTEVLSFITNNSLLTATAKIDGSYWTDAEEGKRHPMREFQEGGANYLSTNVIASKNFIDYLINNSDPRLDALFEAPSSGHEGAFFGDFDSKKDSDSDGTLDEKENYSMPIFAADMDLIIMSNWEVYFNIAEVYARAGDATNAKMYYDFGVTASLEQNSTTDTTIITSGYATWVNGTIEENIKQIAMQRWVANANYQHIESFLERNRTKYPSVNTLDIKRDRQYAFENFPVGQLTISVAGREKTNARVPVSPVYPTDILNRNTNAPDQKQDLLEKVWWNQKVGN